MLENIVFPSNLIKRPLLQPILDAVLDKEKVVILLGARQTGKSSLIYLVIRHLLEIEGVSEQQLFYFDAERINTTTLLDKFTPRPELLIAYLKARQADLNLPVFVFIDEIQYLSAPARLIKFLHDHYPNLVLVLSGSSSLDIKQKFSDRLTGRNRTFVAEPLSFSGFLRFKGYRVEADYLNRVVSAVDHGKTQPGSLDPELAQGLLGLFEEYVVIGGYPGVVKRSTRKEEIVELEEIYSDYVRKDVRDIANIEDTTGYNRLVGLLAGQMGGLVNESELSISSTLSRPTVRKYLSVLERTFVVNRLSPFYRNPRQEFVKMPKVYFKDTGMRNMVIRNFDSLADRVDAGQLVENVVGNNLGRKRTALEELFFWRTQGKAEVDFILRGERQKLIPIEVKYQLMKHAKIPSGLRAFIGQYSPDRAYVVTRSFWGEAKVDKTQIRFLPAWIFYTG